MVWPLLVASDAGSLSSRFTALDWAVLAGYLVLVSVLGVALAGRQRGMADFFRGGDRLPWYAVSGSMIATMVSAVTFVSVPAFAFTHDMTYLQFGIIAGLLSRLFVCFVLIPAYYRHRVYSPYDYMGMRLGEAARSVTTALFSLLGLLAQAARVYLTAFILELILHDQLAAVAQKTGIGSLVWAVTLIGVVAVVWTALGGIATVVWTDVMLFLVFILGGVIALAVIVAHLPGGIGQLFADGFDADKLRVFRLAVTLPADSPYTSIWGAVFAEPYTLWAAVFAVTFSNIGSFGTDQLLAQRIFCCRNQRQAKLAVFASYAGELVVALMLLVGVGLWVFYQQFPGALAGQAGVAVEEKADNIFPVFILTRVPAGLTGLIVAGIFAAAISSLTSILAALAQTTLSAVYLPLRRIDPDSDAANAHSREILLASRVLIVVWGAALCLTAFGIDAYVEAMKSQGREVLLLDLALGLANYVVGSLLAAFLLAWLPLGVNAYGLIWSAPLSVFMVLAARFHDTWTVYLCAGVAAALLVSWVVAALFQRRRGALLARTGWLIVGCALLFLTTEYLWFAKVGSDVQAPIAWPWYAPIGGATAFVFGYLLAEKRAGADSSQL